MLHDIVSKLLVTRDNAPCYSLKNGTLSLRVTIQPNASCDEIVGTYGNSIKIRLSAKPIAGAANKHLIKYLAKCFKIKKIQIKIRSGLSSRTKTLEIDGLDTIPDILC